MQSSHSPMCQILPLAFVLNAIQQDKVDFPCPGGTFLCAAFRTHVDPSTAIPPGHSLGVPPVRGKKSLLDIQAFGKPDFAVRVGLVLNWRRGVLRLLPFRKTSRWRFVE